MQFRSYRTRLVGLVGAVAVASVLTLPSSTFIS
jgi:hypothetical protein